LDLETSGTVCIEGRGTMHGLRSLETLEPPCKGYEKSNTPNGCAIII